MVNSMTGYGRFEGKWQDSQCIIELKSVNHRFLEYHFRMPRQLMLMEDSIKKVLEKTIQRGRIEIFITLDTEVLLNKRLLIDWTLADQYMDALQALQQKYTLQDQPQLQQLQQLEGIFTLEEEQHALDQITAFILDGVRQAAQSLCEMRAREGQQLLQDLQGRIASIQQAISKLSEFAPRVKVHYAEKLKQRLQEMLPEHIHIDDQRLLTEIALFADKADIHEELVRLDSHTKHFLAYLQESGPLGRKCDFLIQEMNREINTIGSKSHDIQIGQLVVELKSELEKMREQVQNIE